MIEATEEIVKDSKVFYQNIWVVFDKDDFKDFDEAIRLGKEKGYKIAWSNQSFEYWLYLHFNYADTALHRDDWCENSMRYSSNIIWGMEPTIKIVKRFSI